MEQETKDWLLNFSFTWLAVKQTERECARQAGVSPSTFSRVLNGTLPNLDNYFKLNRWMISRRDKVEAFAHRIGDSFKTLTNDPCAHCKGPCGNVACPKMVKVT